MQLHRYAIAIALSLLAFANLVRADGVLIEEAGVVNDIACSLGGKV